MGFSTYPLPHGERELKAGRINAQTGTSVQPPPEHRMEKPLAKCEGLFHFYFLPLCWTLVEDALPPEVGRGKAYPDNEAEGYPATTIHIIEAR